MATSGSKNFELDVSDYIEEAFERCGVEVRTGYDLKTAKRSLNLLLADWANRGLNQWTIKQTTVTCISGTADYTLDADTIDILSVVVRRDKLIFDRLVRIDDADTFKNTMEVPFRFYPCLAAGLAYYISIKKAPNRTQFLKAIYEEEFERAMTEDRDRASFNVAPSLEYYRVN